MSHYCYVIVTFLVSKTIFLKFKKFTLQTFINAVTIIHISYIFKIMTPEAERFNGWAAMLGFVAAVGAYVTTGQIIPGWF